MVRIQAIIDHTAYFMGNHLLTPYQSECLKDAGYSQEVEKAARTYLLNTVNSGKLLNASEMQSAIELLDKGDITKRDSIVNQYLSKMVSQIRPFRVPLSSFKKGSDSEKIYCIYALASHLLNHTHTGTFICEKQGDKFVLECTGPLGDGLTFFEISWIPIGAGDSRGSERWYEFVTKNKGRFSDYDVIVELVDKGDFYVLDSKDHSPSYCVPIYGVWSKPIREVTCSAQVIPLRDDKAELSTCPERILGSLNINGFEGAELGLENVVVDMNVNLTYCKKV